MPFWIQQRLHLRWLDSICVYGQAQGSDGLQLDVDRALKATNTQARCADPVESSTRNGTLSSLQFCSKVGYYPYLLKPQQRKEQRSDQERKSANTKSCT